MGYRPFRKLTEARQSKVNQLIADLRSFIYPGGVTLRVTLTTNRASYGLTMQGIDRLLDVKYSKGSGQAARWLEAAMTTALAEQTRNAAKRRTTVGRTVNFA